MTAIPPTDQQLANIRSSHERTTHPGWRGDTHVGQLLADRARLAAELGRVRAELATEKARFDGDDLLLLCSACVCADCGGALEQHAPGGNCSCGCEPACDRFVQDSQLDLIAGAAEPITGSPLSEAIAHVVWHALTPAAPST